ncbi:MAG TPA: hypothetical protein VMR06_02645 [Dokdonella sp.]|uniref:hypothetical protein n=1 Tax=Dokdonella sp. TaxID=2291710 RepID=UPI002C43EB92|nr:hypothetical protein [Dokdonella sp.]HUD40876.1 hypothetical protein [Dokdonella sp.]
MSVQASSARARASLSASAGRRAAVLYLSLAGLGACALAAGHAEAAVLTVGSGGSCSHANVQAAVNAAQASPGPDTIQISRSQAWTAQQISINTDQDLELLGGFSSCGAPSDAVKTVLSGAGGDARPVLTVRGNGIVRLRNLTLTEGDQGGDDNGGGLFYEGGGILDIASTSISNNVAHDGGGLYAVGTSILAEVVLGADVVISGNTARNSGGGMVSKSLETSIVGPRTALTFNKALGQAGGGYGGGLVVVSDQFKSNTYLSSNGIGGIGVIYGNEAVHGGGLAVLAGQDSEQEARALVYSTDTAQPVRINNNQASARGGGIYVQSDADAGPDSADAYAILWRAALNDNRAPDGAAAYVDQDSSLGSFRRGIFQISGLEQAAACPVGAPCNEMIGNSTGNATGAILRNRGIVVMHRVDIRENEGGRLLYSTDYPFATIRNSLMADNAAAEELLRSADEGEQSSYLTMSHVTIAGNAIGAPHAVFVNHIFNFDRSLVAQPGKITLADSPGPRNIEYVLTNDIDNMSGAFVLGDPRFINPPAGDYHLRAGSYAVDFAPSAGGVDLDGIAHTTDMPIGGILDRTADVGAYERPQLQPLVLNADFNVDLTFWEPSGASNWDGTQNAAGPAGSGSVQSTIGIDDFVVAARAQCVHLPGPGTYFLNGWGRVTAGSPFSNTVRLRWELRSNGGALTCRDGAPILQGVHMLAQGPTWRQPPGPAVIELSEVDWTRNASLTVFLEVVNGNPIKGLGEGEVPNGGPTGWFDGVTLGLDGDDRIFADDFEN